MKINNTLNEIEELFSIFDDPKDRFAQLMDIAKDSEGIADSERTEKAKVSGCTSQAWVICDKRDNNYFFKCDSDALIVKGLLALLCKIYSGHESKEIQAVSHADILKTIGLSGLISLQRTNGFASAVTKIHEMSI
jgi:cysteine desulfuration protein SufE